MGPVGRKMVHLNVKWGKEMFRDVEADTEQPPLVFKSQLYTLSGVPPERCKVMFRGKLLGDESWEGFKLKEGQQIMMMGSSEATSVVTAPQVTPVFLEDLPEEEQDGAPLAIYGAGLKNLGNTCYMNSTLQCLYAVPELRASLVKFVPRGAGLDPSEQLTAEVARLFGDIEQAKGPVLPARFLLTLRNSFPQFAEVGDGGVYKQQDAEECWSQVMQALGEKLRVSLSSMGDEVECSWCCDEGSGGGWMHVSAFFSNRSSALCAEDLVWKCRMWIAGWLGGEGGLGDVFE